MAAKITRRQVIGGAALAAGAGAAYGVTGGISALASVTVAPHSANNGGDTLVVLFLRGGADGLNIVAPHGDDHYYRLRPTLALARPHDRAAPQAARALDLDGYFGLHPALEPLLPFYREGHFAVVHAVGSGDNTRSHFEAMATMERGLNSETGAASGWLARHLAATERETMSPLRAVAVTETMPDTLRGASNVVALTSLADYRLAPPESAGHARDHAAGRADALAASLRALYQESGQGAAGSTSIPLERAGRETLTALDAIRRLNPAEYRPAPGVTYPPNEIGNGFRQAACLIKGDVGMEAAFLEMGGWDTHVAQGRDAGILPSRLGDLGRALAAFCRDLGSHLGRTTVVVMTEFGRRAYENYSLGTDHGRASCLFVLGGGVNGGRVFADWHGLAPEQLEEPGDLRVTTDYRDILAEILVRRVKNPHLAAVFPEYTPRFHNVVRPA